MDTAHATVRTGPYDPDEHQVALVICDHARDRADALVLLDTCGLLRSGAAPPASPAGDQEEPLPAHWPTPPAVRVPRSGDPESPAGGSIPRRCKRCRYLRTRCACPGGPRGGG